MSKFVGNAPFGIESRRFAARERRVGDDRPGSRRAERGDRVADVAGDPLGLVRVGQGQAAHAEVATELRPVEAAPGRDQHEQVVVLAAADDDGAQQRFERDALHLGALLGAVGGLGADDAVGDAEVANGRDRGRVVGVFGACHRAE